MRMIDFFPEKLTLCGDTIEDSDYAYSVMTCEYLVNGVDAGEAMCHAINHHDKMVDKLRELADSLKESARRMRKCAKEIEDKSKCQSSK